MDSQIIPDNVKQEIINNIILPSYVNDITYIIKTRSRWSTISSICITLSTVFIGLTSIFSFLSSKIGDNSNIYAGSFAVFSLVLKEFASYANYQDHIKTIEVNDILEKLNIKLKIDDTSKFFQNNNDDLEKTPLNSLK